MSDPQALHVTRNVIPGKLGVDLHLHRVHIPLVIIIIVVIINDIAKWMDAKRLQLNAAKTEILCCSSQRQKSLNYRAFLVCGSSVIPSSVVRDLSVYIDNGLKHV